MNKDLTKALLKDVLCESCKWWVTYKNGISRCQPRDLEGYGSYSIKPYHVKDELQSNKMLKPGVACESYVMKDFNG